MSDDSLTSFFSLRQLLYLYPKLRKYQSLQKIALSLFNKSSVLYLRGCICYREKIVMSTKSVAQGLIKMMMIC